MVDFKKLLDKLQQEEKTKFDDVMCGRCGDVVLHERIDDKWKCCLCGGLH